MGDAPEGLTVEERVIPVIDDLERMVSELNDLELIMLFVLQWLHFEKEPFLGSTLEELRNRPHLRRLPAHLENQRQTRFWKEVLQAAWLEADRGEELRQSEP